MIGHQKVPVSRHWCCEDDKHLKDRMRSVDDTQAKMGVEFNSIVFLSKIATSTKPNLKHISLLSFVSWNMYSNGTQYNALSEYSHPCRAAAVMNMNFWVLYNIAPCSLHYPHSKARATLLEAHWNALRKSIRVMQYIFSRFIPKAMAL
jgi:hypothetical protein